MIKLRVTGMTCQHCERAVSEALDGVSGVDEVVSVSHERNEATVEGSPDVSALISAVKDEGYEAEAAR
jgi:copper chaperone